MKLTVTPLDMLETRFTLMTIIYMRVLVDVHVPTLVQFLVGQTTHLVEHGHCPMSSRYFPH